MGVPTLICLGTIIMIPNVHLGSLAPVVPAPVWYNTV